MAQYTERKTTRSTTAPGLKHFASVDTDGINLATFNE